MMHKALDKLFFIFADARSGNAFLSSRIIAHMEVIIPPGSNFIPRILNQYPYGDVSTKKERELFINIIFSEDKFKDWNLDRGEIAGIFENDDHISREKALLEILSLYCKKYGPDAKALGIQKDYIDIYKQLHTFLPQSKIIWLMRDGRAVFNSQKRTLVSDGSYYFAVCSKDAALAWVCKNQKLSSYSKIFKNVFKVKYEPLIIDTQETLKKIGEFLELSYHEKPHAKMKIPERYNKIHQNVAKNPLNARINAWKSDLDPQEIIAYERIAGKYLQKNGYELENKQPPFVQLFSGILIFCRRSLREMRTFLSQLKHKIKHDFSI